MSAQLDLVYQPNSETSKAAAKRMGRKPDKVLRDRQAILDYLRATPSTDAEMQAALIMSGNTQRPRRNELAKAGLIAHTGERRNGSAVWGVVR